ncbi:MAG TPA: N-acetyltransferase [Geothrix sp.]|jgi:putative acetyltransferase
MIIRPETEADVPAIDRINIEAFLNHPFSHQTEHLIVRALRASGALALSLVADLDGQVVGHIAFSPALIDGQNLGWYTLGPVAVLPSHQRQGIGSMLVNAGLDGIRALGANGCLLVGDPSYYIRFGFKHQPSLRIHEVPPEYFMGISFSEDIPSGLVTHHQAFFTMA